MTPRPMNLLIPLAASALLLAGCAAGDPLADGSASGSASGSAVGSGATSGFGASWTGGVGGTSCARDGAARPNAISEAAANRAERRKAKRMGGPFTLSLPPARG